MNIRELRQKLGDTQSEFASRYHIPFRTIQNWESGIRKPPEYILDLLKSRIDEDLINKKTREIPRYDSKKIDLPKRSNYVGAKSWLKEIQNILGEDVVFALDQALMCHELFLGRNDEPIIWVYGNDELEKYNGVVVLSNEISSNCIVVKDGLKFTDFNRTINDAIANEDILDMQGITEAISHYYYSNNESINNISIFPKYQERFDSLLIDAINYYEE